GIPAGAGSLLGKRLGKYEVLALLALGGTAEIYLARIDGTNGFEKFVVIKCLHDHLADDTEFVKMFLDEARLAALLEHPNIVQTFELGEHENRYYMVMEFLAGLSLAMVVRRAAERVPGARVPVPLILNIAAQAAAGLHYAHERTQSGKPLNMVHRDISPQNLVIGFEGVVKVVDFGIARAEYRETKTKAGTIKGKFAYMSPEQCVATNVDRRTDVFALGVIVHELLTGRRLFKRNSPYETYQAVIDCAVAPPSTVNVELDPALDKLIMKAVAKEKEDRFPTAEAFGDEMLGYLHHRGKGSGPGEIAKWFEEHFQQEIEEHSDRMRELISGRDSSSLDLGWDEVPEAKKSETVPFRKAKENDDEEEELHLQTGDVQEMRRSEASLEHFVSRLSTEADVDDVRDDDGGPPPEKTRIEANPLEVVQALEAAAGRSKVPVPLGSVTGGPAPLPAPPTVVATKPTNDQGKTLQPENNPVTTEAAYKATMVHAAQRPPTAGPEMAPTMAAPPIDPAVGALPSIAMTHVDRIGSQSATHEAVRMSPEQMAVLENVRPKERPSEPSYGGSPYPVRSGGRPYSTDIAPSDRPGQQAAPQFNGQQAASLMSPVGEQYPQQDWDAAAAVSAKALTPLQLILLFIAVVAGAVTITMIVAKLAH
ncbi:MAG: protein kinase, partial [Kofleriaceae bacterium]